ncbi:PucR family transcriptional regulator [Embleya hyalina]|uniref:DNA-binding protein n=1 Tax=Embleya hyalina TaxID=516124 RepID=A0A401YQS4_9ACTN|nr:PucR family transcriptional regulator [Embleya hyalina]GCD96941.1 DNA-binding protein [Embleya hyalina]
MPETPHPLATVTLAGVLALVGDEVMEVVYAPGGIEVPVTGVDLFAPEDDHGERGGRGRHRVLLAIGVHPTSPAVATVLAAARRAGAAAVVVRGGPEPIPALLHAAIEREAAVGESPMPVVLTRGPDWDWAQVLDLLRTSLTYTSVSGTDAADELPIGDLPGLANVVADMVGGAITIEDPQSRVLAYSRMDREPDPLRRLTILGQRVPAWRVAELRQSGFFRTLWASDDAVRLPADDRHAERLVIAVRDGAHVLGSIWVAADGRPLTDAAAGALRLAARAAAPHLVHHRTRGRPRERRRERALGVLLDEGTAARRPELAGAARTLGLDVDRPYSVTVAEVRERGSSEADARPDRSPVDPGPPSPSEQRLLDVLALQATASAHGVCTTRVGHRLFVVAPVGTEPVTARAEQLLSTVASFPTCVVFAGVGPVAGNLLELPAARLGAETALRVLRRRAALGAAPPTSAFVSAGDVVVEATLLEALERMKPVWEAATSPIHTMLDHDRAHGSHYGATVSAYLEVFGDTARAARRLHITRNTLRYRLRRAHELFGVDLTDPGTRLLAELGLRLIRGHP